MIEINSAQHALGAMPQNGRIGVMANQSRKEVLSEKQCVILKGRRDGISVLLDDKAEFDLIKDVLRKRVAGSRKFFEGAKSAVTFKGRQLSEQEEKILLNIIQFEANLDVETEAIPAEPRLLPTSPFGMQPIVSETFYYQNGIRSGQTIQQNGSVVIVGDVNPGATIKATGNIIVLGALRGTAWAGAPPEEEGDGDENCFVSASEFKPIQIRIARIVTYIPEEAVNDRYDNGAWAYIHDSQVFIAPLM